MSLKIENTLAAGEMEVDSQATSVATTVTTLGATSTDAPLSDTTYGALTASGTNNVSTTHASGDIMSLTSPIVAGGVGRRRNDQAMPAVPLGDFLKRNVLVSTISSFSAPTVFSPWKLWSENAYVADKLKNFAYITGSMKIKGVLKAPPMAAGLVVVSAVPNASPYYTESAVPPALSLVYDHVVLDIANSTDFELEVPWIYRSGWAETTPTLGSENYKFLWTITVQALAPITSSIPDGVAATTLRIYCVPGDDFEISGPTYQGKKRGAVNLATPPRVESRGKFSQIADRVSQAAGVAATFPSLAPFAAPVIGAATGLSKVLDLFGLTRDSVVEKPSVALLKPTSNLLNCDGVDHSRMAALFSDNAISIDPAASGTMSDVDECSFSHIGSRYTLISAIKFTVGDSTPEDFVIPVTPFFATPGSDSTSFVPTTSGYLGARFAFWRGDVKYLVYPVVSAVHRGALQFMWQPDVVPGPDSVDYTNISLNSIVDVGCAQPIEVNIGYASHSPVLGSKFYKTTSVPSASDRFYANGHLRIRNIVPFTGSKSGEEITVLIFQASGENMEFSKPTDRILVDSTEYTWGHDASVRRAVTYESGTVGADGQSVVRVDLVPSSGNYPLAENLSGEVVRSVRALIQKPSLYKKFSDFAPLGDEPHNPGGGSSANYFHYYGSMFLGFAGSIRYKILIDRSCSSEAGVRPYPCVNRMLPVLSGERVGTAGILSEICPTVCGDLYTLEYTIPYYGQKLYYPAVGPTDFGDHMSFAGPYNFERKITGAVYRSAGSDARLVYFLAQNEISLNPTVNGSSLRLPYHPFDDKTIPAV